MAYTAGDTILDDEYNLFVTGTSGSQYGINHIQGTGNAGYGLGQSDVATVSAGNTVQASPVSYTHLTLPTIPLV